MSLAEYREWVMAYNAAHGEGHQLSPEEETSLMAWLDQTPVWGNV